MKPVLDPRFMHREAEAQRCEYSLKNNESILIVGIRRTGKSQLVKAVLCNFAKSGQRVEYLDVSAYTDLHQFFAALLASLPKSLAERALGLLAVAKAVPDAIVTYLRDHVDKAGVFGVDIDFNPPTQAHERYWEPLANSLITAVQQTDKTGELPILGIDELPFMLNNLLERNVASTEVSSALAALRVMRQSGLRMIITGSISLENLLSISGVSHTVLGGLRREHVPPFTRAEAKAYLQKELPSGFPDVDLEAVLDSLPDYVPDFLAETVRYLQSNPDRKTVEETIREKVMPALHRSFIRQFEERLASNYQGEETGIAHSMLDQLARASKDGGSIELRSENGEHAKVLLKLQYDMFIEQAQNFGWRFTLQILRTWWRSYRAI